MLGRPRLSVLMFAVLALALMPVAHARAQVIEDIEDEFEFEEPEIQEPEIDEPEIDEPEIDEPEIDEPETDEPEIDEPEIDEPEIDEPEIESPEIGETEDGDDEFAGVDPSDDDLEDDDRSASSSDDEGAELDDGLDTEVSPADILFGEEWLADLAQTQDPEFDNEGNPVRRGEVVALDLSPAGLALLLGHGFVPIGTSSLPALDAQLTTLAAPEGQSAQAALDLARSLDPAGIFDLGHFYSSPYQASTGRTARAAQPVPSRSIVGNLRIGLIDTDVRPADLPRRVTVESRAFGQAGAPRNSDHGTAVAAILSANGAGELVVANVFDNDGQIEFTSAQSISNALGWLLEQRVAVVNISLAGPRNAVLDTLVHRAAVRGTVIVAAAGNGGPAAPPAYPAALPDVVAVTAVDSTRRIYRYANRGSYVRLATYGVRVEVEFGGGGTTQLSGTSFAAPRVAARIASCIAAGTGPQACIRRLEDAADDLGSPGRDEVYGFGLID